MRNRLTDAPLAAGFGTDTEPFGRVIDASPYVVCVIHAPNYGRGVRLVKRNRSIFFRCIGQNVLDAVSGRR